MGKLRYVRIGLACAVFLAVVLVFFGIPWGLVFIEAQLVPSLLRGLSPLVAGGTVFALLLLLTLVCGRLYCSVLCPLGILQDVMGRLQKLGKQRTHYRPLPKLRFLHYGTLLLLCIPLLFGSAMGLALLDPYSIFGRFMNSVVSPLFWEANNQGARLLLEVGQMWLIPVKVFWPPLWSLLLTLGLILLVLVGVIWNGRVFCNTLCPAGALLRLVSSISLFQLKIKDTLCNRCGACQKACKAGCIDRKTKEIDFSRCVLCFNCVDECGKGGIGFVINPLWKRLFRPSLRAGNAPTKSLAQTNFNFTRRRFLYSGVLATSSLVFGPQLVAQRGEGRGRGGRGRRVQGRNAIFDYLDPLPPTLPPGAVNLEHFQAYCTACQLCVNQCPTHGLVPGFLEFGWKGMQQPVFDFDQGYCFFECNACTQVCPTGALTPLDLAIKKTTRIGVARFFRSHCVVHTERNECGACIEHCPVIAVTGTPYRSDYPNLLLPVVDEDLCIGCGICEWICPEAPSAIRVEGLTVHETAKIKEIKPLEHVPDLSEDFPF